MVCGYASQLSSINRQLTDGHIGVVHALHSTLLYEGAVMYNVGAVRLCPKGDPKGLGCSTPKGSERSITW